MTDKPTVHEAFSAVMADVQSIGKNERNEQQRFVFRGIDTVMGAVGPKLREHGVVIVPEAQHVDAEMYETSKGTRMMRSVVLMKFTVYGPGGDSFAGVSYGEASDSGDKGVTKAQSVAYRTFLLQSLTVPTNDPEPDYEVHERGQQPQQAAPQPMTLEQADARIKMTRGDHDALLALYNEATAAGAGDDVINLIKYAGQKAAESAGVQ